MDRRSFLKLATACAISVVLPWTPEEPRGEWVNRSQYNGVFLEAAERNMDHFYFAANRTGKTEFCTEHQIMTFKGWERMPNG